VQTVAAEMDQELGAMGIEAMPLAEVHALPVSRAATTDQDVG
jgi:hypothetical protein